MLVLVLVPLPLPFPFPYRRYPGYVFRRLGIFGVQLGRRRLVACCGDGAAGVMGDQ